MSVALNEMNPHILREDALADPRLWAVKYRVHPKDKDASFVFERVITVNKLGMQKTVPLRYLDDPYMCLLDLKDLYMVVKKGRQARVSEFLINATTYACDKNKRVVVLYILQDEQVGKWFVQTRINTAIEWSPYLNSMVTSGAMKKSGRKKEIDSLSLKKFFNSFFYMLHSTSKKASRSPSADIVIFDEYDQHDLVNETSFRSTIDDSEIQALFYVSTPTDPDFGIDRKFKSTSMGVWTVNCRNCLEDFIMDSAYFFGDGVKKLPEQRWQDGAIRIFVCPHCGEELYPADKQIRGRYVHQHPELLKEKRFGFSFPNLILPHITADKAWSQYRECLLGPRGRKTYVNEKLGEACVDEDATVHFNREIILECQDKNLGWIENAYGTLMGVDWGKDTHVVVWKNIENGLQLLNYFVFPANPKPLENAKEVIKLVARFNPKKLISDFGGGQEQNKYVSERVPDGIFYVAVNAEGLKDLNPRWNQKTRIVNYELITSYSAYASWYPAKMIKLPKYDTKLEMFIQHHLNTTLLDPNERPVEERTTEYATPVGKTKSKKLGKKGPIHLVSASLFGWLDCMGKSVNDFSFSALPKEFKDIKSGKFTMFNADDVLSQMNREKIWVP